MKIYVEANIGSGKTTILKILAEFLKDKINTIQEPVDEWLIHFDENNHNILTKYYQDMKRWSFTFQINSLSTRLNKFLKEYQKDKPNIIERSIFSDGNCFSQLCYQEGNMDQLELYHYQEILKLMANNFDVKPDAIIYLKTRPEVCFDRINKRARNGEEGISIDYLTKLHQVHEKWIKNTKDQKINVLELDADLDFENDPEIRLQFIDKISEFIDMLNKQKTNINYINSYELRKIN